MQEGTGLSYLTDVITVFWWVFPLWWWASAADGRRQIVREFAKRLGVEKAKRFEQEIKSLGKLHQLGYAIMGLVASSVLGVFVAGKNPAILGIIPLSLYCLLRILARSVGLKGRMLGK